VVTTEQPTIDLEIPLHRARTVAERRSAGRAAAERAARESLRSQVAKLERELSGIVAGRFPHVSPGSDAPPPHRAGRPGGFDVAHSSGRAGPHILTLAELELLRDRLVLRVREAQRQAGQRSELETRSRDLLERMRREPGRYKFVRLPVTDLGEHGCGMWEVRPRLGLIGMLAGWWELKLSSGCPLPEPRAGGARLPPARGRALPCAFEANAGPCRDRARLRVGFELRPPRRRPPSSRSSLEHDCRLLVAGRGEGAALTIGHRPDGLGL
jgi:hypothetical protein